MGIDVTVGEWRNGLTNDLAADIAYIEDRFDKGFRQLPWESTVAELIHILDAYDEVLPDMTVCECARSAKKKVDAPVQS